LGSSALAAARLCAVAWGQREPTLAPTLADVVAEVGGWHPVTLRQFGEPILVFVFYPKIADPETFAVWENGQGNFDSSIYPRNFDPETFRPRENGQTNFGNPF